MRAALAVACVVLLLAAGSAQAGDGLKEIWSVKDGLWTMKIHAYAPPNLRRPSAPAVVLLHGCLQGPKEFFDNSGWHQVADERGLLLVVAEFDDPGEHCLWWFQPDQRRPATASQGNAIVTGLAEARRQLQVPDGENYVAGLSAGAAMSLVMLSLYPDTFAAGASMAGVPFDCPSMTTASRIMWANQPCVMPGAPELSQACACMAGDVDHSPAEWAASVTAQHPGRTRWPRVSIWQGAADPVVLCQDGVETAEQWSALHGGGGPQIACPPAKGQIAVKRDPTQDLRWTQPGTDGRMAVELRILHGFGHAVPVAQGCGEPGKFFSEAGVCAAREIAKFFSGS